MLRRPFTVAGSLAAAVVTLLCAGVAPACAQNPAPKLLAIVGAHTTGLSNAAVARARQSAVHIARQLGELGAMSIAADADDKCSLTAPAKAVIGDAAGAVRALSCLKSQPDALEVVILYYVGQVAYGDDLKLFAGGRSEEAAKAGVSWSEALQARAERGQLVSVVIIDPLSPSVSENEPPIAKRIEVAGTRRVLALGVPVGEVPEPPAARSMLTAYAQRLSDAFDVELAAKRAGGPMRDIRSILSASEVVAGGAGWRGRMREVIVEGVGNRRITLAGIDASEFGLFSMAPPASPIECNSTPLEAISRATCASLLQFRQSCPQHTVQPLVDTTLRLRCPKELVEHKKRLVVKDFEAADAAGSCASLTKFVEQYGTDPDLLDVPELEKAAGVRVRLCEKEARERELAALDTRLNAAVSENDCSLFRRLKSDTEPRMSASSEGASQLGDDDALPVRGEGAVPTSSLPRAGRERRQLLRR